MRRFKIGDLVWIYRPPKGKGISKLVHQCLGPVEVVDEAGYENFCVERKDHGALGEQLIVHTPAERDEAATVRNQAGHDAQPEHQRREFGSQTPLSTPDPKQQQAVKRRAAHELERVLEDIEQLQ